MATYLAVCVRDEALQAFNRPFFVNSVGFAMRSFEDEVNRKSPDNPMSSHAKDFSLWHVGSFDEDTAKLVSLDVPVRLCDALSVLKPNPEG
ncbi:MAG: nonstructural protein [Microviridae sp.]|nr:MAG: nonstructural protein [Microviridae sp.]